MVIQAPKDATYNVLLGIALVVSNPTYRTNIKFIPRNKPKSTGLYTAHNTTQRALGSHLEEEVKALLKSQC